MKELLCGTSVWPLVFLHIVGQPVELLRGTSVWPLVFLHSVGQTASEGAVLWDISVALYQLQAVLGMPMLLQRMFHHHRVNLLEIVLGRHLPTFQSGESL